MNSHLHHIYSGKISNLSITKEAEGTQSAAVTFEKPTAAKTALLLDNTQLGSNLVVVSAAASLDQLSDKGAQAGAHSSTESPDDVDQEDKPRSRILAEYLAHGYTVSDKTIERAIALDSQHGISSRFTSALKNFDDRYKASERAQGLDTKYGVTEKAGASWRGMNSYFEKAMNTPTGQKIRSFYLDGQKQVMDVHQEARRLTDLKTGKTTPEQAAAGMITVPGTSKTTCSCGGDTGKCPCPPGKCACSNCPKSEGPTDASLIEKMQMEQVPGTERTRCQCGGSSGTCPCEPGKCACANCGKNPDNSSGSASGPTASGDLGGA